MKHSSRHFNALLDDGRLPADALMSTVIPANKCGDRENYSSYRPVALTSFVLKTLERVIRERIDNHLGDNNLLMTGRYGLWQEHYCLTNLKLLGRSNS